MGGLGLCGPAAVFCAAHCGHDRDRPRIHQLSAIRSLDPAVHHRPGALAPTVDALRQHLRPAQTRRHRLGRRQLCDPRRRGLERHRKSLGAQRQGRGPGQQSPGPRPRPPRARSQNPRWLHHHPATGQKPAAVRRTHPAAQGAGVCAHAAIGATAEQAAHPGDLSEQRGMGRRCVRR
ncbi:hypothetical protein D3C87_1667340 [compost metagenome]